jgi:Tfp pilus assembly protein PilV
MTRLRTLRQRMTSDEGTTLIEVTVSMVLMSIFMAMFTGAVIMMTNTMNTSQAITETAAQVTAAFREVDETARAASFISTPQQGTDQNWYVEMLSHGRDGTQRCTQLRVDTAEQKLQRRAWTEVIEGPSDLTDWVTIASGITNGGPGTPPPFELKAATGVPLLFQQLVVTLIPASGPGTPASTTGSSFTVTALNSGMPGPGTDHTSPAAATCSGTAP